MRGITAVVSIILLLLITISLVGTAFVFIGRTVESGAKTGEEQVKQQTSQIGILFSIESVDKNHVYVRNAGVTPLQLQSLSFYVNNQKIEAAGPETLASGSMGEYFLNDSKLAMLPDPATLKVSAGAVSDTRKDMCFYCRYYAGYWKFDETSGTTAGDSSGNGNGGTYYGKIFNTGDIMGGAAQTTGKYGYGMSFDGVDDNVTINGLKNRQFSYITVSAWVNAKKWDDNTIVSQWGQGGLGWASFGLGYGNGKLTFGTYDGSGGSTSVTTDYSSTDIWVFVTGQFNGTHCLIYIDGQLKNSAVCNTPQISTQYPVIIGSVPSGGSYFNGTIDEVRIYNRALSQQEIQEDMNSAYPITKAVASYSFEKIENNKVLDTGHIVKGEYGTALGFDGVDDYVKIPHTPSVNTGAVGTSYSVSLWMKTTVNTDMAVMLSKRNDTNGGFPFALFLDKGGSNGYVFADIYDGSKNPVTQSSTDYRDGTWHHILSVRDDSAKKFSLYIDGVLKNSTTDTTSGSLENIAALNIGSQGTYFGNYFNGNIDEVKILNIARSMTTA